MQRQLRQRELSEEIYLYPHFFCFLPKFHLTLICFSFFILLRLEQSKVRPCILIRVGPITFFFDQGWDQFWSYQNLRTGLWGAMRLCRGTCLCSCTFRRRQFIIISEGLDVFCTDDHMINHDRCLMTFIDTTPCIWWPHRITYIYIA